MVNRNLKSWSFFDSSGDWLGLCSKECRGGWTPCCATSLPLVVIFSSHAVLPSLELSWYSKFGLFVYNWKCINRADGNSPRARAKHSRFCRWSETFPDSTCFLWPHLLSPTPPPTFPDSTYFIYSLLFKLEFQVFAVHLLFWLKASSTTCTNKVARLVMNQRLACIDHS